MKVVCSGIAIIAVLSFVYIDRIVDAQSLSTGSAPATVVDDKAPGWMWDHMLSCDASGPPLVSAHAGGPGSSATYIFSGTGITISGISGSTVSVCNTIHRVGKVRVTLDGSVVGQFADASTIVSAHNLADQNHSLIIEPVEAWAAVSGLSVEHAAVATNTSAAVTSSGADALTTPGVYKIVPRVAPDYCIDLYERYTENGSKFVIYTSNNQKNQQFSPTHVGTGKYVFSSLQITTSALSVLPDPTTGMPYIGVWQYMRNDSQTWILTLEPSGYYRISPLAEPAYALTCGQITPPQGDILLQQYTGAREQDWQITPTAPGT
jgi:hypothetical protein